MQSLSAKLKFKLKISVISGKRTHKYVMLSRDLSVRGIVPFSLFP